MRNLLTITYILPSLFIGLIIGGAIAENSAAWISGLVLLAADIILGCSLQFFTENRSGKNAVLLTERERRYLERVIRKIKKVPPPDDRELAETYEAALPKAERGAPEKEMFDDGPEGRDDTVPAEREKKRPQATLFSPCKGKPDEETFAEMQRRSCGFFPDPSYTEAKYEALQKKKLALGMLTAEEESKLIFPMIFGTFGCPIDLKKAFIETQVLLCHTLNRKPEGAPVQENEPYMQWLHAYAVTQILLGTVYACWNEPIKASYHFLIGLKTDCITLNLPYCDFIRYTLDKLSEQKVRPAKYRGCGFSANDPMGSCGGTLLHTGSALQIIPELEGDRGEVIAAKKGRSGMFGHLQRIGSVFSHSCHCSIDIYESYVIDKKYTLRKIRFFFNGYFPRVGFRLKIAKGFHLKPHSEILHFAEIVS